MLPSSLVGREHLSRKLFQNNKEASFLGAPAKVFPYPIVLNQDHLSRGFPGGAVFKNLPANAGDTVLSPGTGRSHTLGSN